MLREAERGKERKKERKKKWREERRKRAKYMEARGTEDAF